MTLTPHWSSAADLNQQRQGHLLWHLTRRLDIAGHDINQYVDVPVCSAVLVDGSLWLSFVEETCNCCQSWKWVTMIVSSQLQICRRTRMMMTTGAHVTRLRTRPCVHTRFPAVTHVPPIFKRRAHVHATHHFCPSTYTCYTTHVARAGYNTLTTCITEYRTGQSTYYTTLRTQVIMQIHLYLYHTGLLQLDQHITTSQCLYTDTRMK